MSTLTLAPETAPIRVDADGVARIGGTRVTLDTVVAAFESGATAEEIVQRYPAVALADVYATIAYYLHRREEVSGYLESRRDTADRVRHETDTRNDQQGIRARLMARRSG